MTKKFVIFSSIFILSMGVFQQAHAAPSVAQACEQEGYSTSLSCTFSSNISAGDVIVAWIAGRQATATPAISGCNISWNPVYVNTTGFGSWYGTVGNTGSCTLTLAENNSGWISAGAEELNGVQAVVDVSQAAFSSGASPYNSPSITTTGNGDLVAAIWFATGYNNPGMITIASPFTTQQNISGIDGGVMGYFIQSTAGSVSTSFAVGSTVYGWATQLIAFKPALGGGGNNSGMPSVPGGLMVSGATTSTVSLSWGASSEQGGAGSISGYKIYRNGLQAGTASGTLFTDIGLSPSTSYRYTVASMDANGNISPQSSAVDAFTQTAASNTLPSVPTGLLGTAVSSSQINISW